MTGRKEKILPAFSCGEIFFLFYKIRADRRFLFRQTELFLAERNAFHKERHIPCKRAHCLLAFAVLIGFAGRATVYRIPVPARSNWHSGDCEIFVQLVKRCRAAAASGTDDARPDLHCFVEAGAVKKPVKQGDKRCIGGRVINRACDDKSVRRLEFRRKLV